MWNVFFKIQPLSCRNWVDSRFSYFSLDLCRSRLDLLRSNLDVSLDLCRSRLDPSRSRVDLCRSNQNHVNCFICSTDITDGFKLIYDPSMSRFVIKIYIFKNKTTHLINDYFWLGSMQVQARPPWVQARPTQVKVLEGCGRHMHIFGQ